jgi:hypothetical protein
MASHVKREADVHAGRSVAASRANGVKVHRTAVIARVQGGQRQSHPQPFERTAKLARVGVVRLPATRCGVRLEPQRVPSGVINLSGSLACHQG